MLTFQSKNKDRFSVLKQFVLRGLLLSCSLLTFQVCSSTDKPNSTDKTPVIGQCLPHYPPKEFNCPVCDVNVPIPGCHHHHDHCLADCEKEISNLIIASHRHDELLLSLKAKHEDLNSAYDALKKKINSLSNTKLEVSIKALQTKLLENQIHIDELQSNWDNLCSDNDEKWATSAQQIEAIKEQFKKELEELSKSQIQNVEDKIKEVESTQDSKIQQTFITYENIQSYLCQAVGIPTSEDLSNIDITKTNIAELQLRLNELSDETQRLRNNMGEPSTLKNHKVFDDLVRNPTEGPLNLTKMLTYLADQFAIFRETLTENVEQTKKDLSELVDEKIIERTQEFETLNAQLQEVLSLINGLTKDEFQNIKNLVSVVANEVAQQLNGAVFDQQFTLKCITLIQSQLNTLTTQWSERISALENSEQSMSSQLSQMDSTLSTITDSSQAISELERTLQGLDSKLQEHLLNSETPQAFEDLKSKLESLTMTVSNHNTTSAQTLDQLRKDLDALELKCQGTTSSPGSSSPSGDWQQALTEVNSKFSQLETQYTQLKSTMDTHGREYEELKEQVQQTQQKVEPLEQTTGQLQSTVTSLTEKSNELTQSVNQANDGLTQLQQTVETNKALQDQISERLNTLADKIGVDVSSPSTSLNQTLEKLKETVDEHSTSLNDVRQQITQLQNADTALVSRIEALESQTDITEIQEALEKIETLLGTSSSGGASGATLIDQIQTLNNKVAAQDQTIASQMNTLASLAGSLETQQQINSTQATTISTQGGRITSLESAVSALQTAVRDLQTSLAEVRALVFDEPNNGASSSRP